MADKRKPVAIHEKTGDKHGVGFGDLKVVIVKDGPREWFAQGLDIDYAAEGTSLPNVQKNFQEGFKSTVELHLRIYGHIENFLRAAPPEVWREFAYDPSKKPFFYSHVSVHEVSSILPDEMRIYVPYTAIKFFQTERNNPESSELA